MPNMVKKKVSTSSIEDIIFEDLKTEKDFDELKVEFCVMYQDLKDKDEEIDLLKKELTDAKGMKSETDGAANKTVEQMEELHEHLAELDKRFERAEKLNEQLKDEKEEQSFEFQKEMDAIKEILSSTQLECDQMTEKLTKISEEYKNYKATTNKKIHSMEILFQNSLQNLLNPLSSYIQKNRGSKIPIKKTKGYRLIKSTEKDLRDALTTTANNNDGMK